MFFVAITKDEISHNFQSVDIEEIKINSFIVTVCIDNFLSKFIPEKNGFSIIESPIISSNDFMKIIFSQVNYDEKFNVFNIFKSSISGRPIYYHINSKGDFFCSTHISMLRKAGVKIEENTEVLPEFFVYRIVMPPRTLYRNINQLSSGDRLHIKISNGKCMVQSLDHYNIPEKNRNIISIKNSSKQIHKFLLQSIEKLDSRKEEIAVMLSGGLDSSILCKICQDIFGMDKSYSTGYPFEEMELNVEKNYAISAAKTFGVNHTYYEATNNDYIKGFLEAISLAENPIHHLQSVCLHLLYKNGIPKNRDIVIEGWGAGGSFGNFRNYLYFKDKLLFKLLSRRPFKVVLKRMPKIVGLGEQTVDLLIKSTFNYPLSNLNHPIWFLHKYGSKKWVYEYLNVTEEDIIGGQYDSLKRFENNSIYDITALYSLLGDEDVTLSILSKIGEGNKKINYFPFYDPFILNYVFSIPWKLKLKSPENILRKEIARQCGVPEFIINRTKSGFGIQSNIWSEKGGVFEPLVPLASKVFDEKHIRNMQSSEPKKAMTFWNILNYSIWKRLCINNEPLELLLEELNEII